tara:strand:- start:739 stop:1527 length:789 start_codon:yes stop_codon:yes gene_type:complete
MFRFLLVALIIGSLFVPDNRNYTPVLSSSPFDKNSNKLLSASPERKETIKNIRSSTFSVAVEFEEGEYSNVIGTGVYLIDKNLGHIVLTAEHVAIAALKNRIRFCSIVSDDCVVMSNRPLLEADTGNLASDWAVYVLEKPLKHMLPARTDNTSVDLGEDVWLIGHPRGNKAWISHGTVAAIYEHPEEKDYTLYGVHSFAAPGFSGGGVYTSLGQLIGITVAIHTDRSGAPQGESALVVPLENVWLLKPSERAQTPGKQESDQ